MKLLNLILILGLIFSNLLVHSSAKTTVEVENIHQLIKEIGSNKKIKIKKGIYAISEIDFSNFSNENIQFLRKYDGGMELNIFDVYNLELIGIDEKMPKIYNKNIYCNIIVFNRCSNISIKNLEFGHYPEKGICMGGVIKMDSCNNINIDNCLLFGSGSDGIATTNTDGVRCSNSIIKECTATILYLENSKNFKFHNCTFDNNGGSNYYSSYIVLIYSCSNIEFNKCDFIKQSDFHKS